MSNHPKQEKPAPRPISGLWRHGRCGVVVLINTLLAQKLHQVAILCAAACFRSEEHTSELQSLMRISYAVFCLKKNTHINTVTKHVRVIYDTHTEHNTTPHQNLSLT